MPPKKKKETQHTPLLPSKSIPRSPSSNAIASQNNGHSNYQALPDNASGEAMVEIHNSKRAAKSFTAAYLEPMWFFIRNNKPIVASTLFNLIIAGLYGYMASTARGPAGFFFSFAANWFAGIYFLTQAGESLVPNDWSTFTTNQRRRHYFFVFNAAVFALLSNVAAFAFVLDDAEELFLNENEELSDANAAQLTGIVIAIIAFLINNTAVRLSGTRGIQAEIYEYFDKEVIDSFYPGENAYAKLEKAVAYEKWYGREYDVVLQYNKIDLLATIENFYFLKEKHSLFWSKLPGAIGTGMKGLFFTTQLYTCLRFWQFMAAKGCINSNKSVHLGLPEDLYFSFVCALGSVAAYSLSAFRLPRNLKSLFHTFVKYFGGTNYRFTDVAPVIFIIILVVGYFSGESNIEEMIFLNSAIARDNSSDTEAGGYAVDVQAATILEPYLDGWVDKILYYISLAPLLNIEFLIQGVTAMINTQGVASTTERIIKALIERRDRLQAAAANTANNNNAPSPSTGKTGPSKEDDLEAQTPKQNVESVSEQASQKMRADAKIQAPLQAQPKTLSEAIKAKLFDNCFTDDIDRARERGIARARGKFYDEGKSYDEMVPLTSVAQDRADAESNLTEFSSDEEQKSISGSSNPDSASSFSSAQSANSAASLASTASNKSFSRGSVVFGSPIHQREPQTEAADHSNVPVDSSNKAPQPRNK